MKEIPGFPGYYVDECGVVWTTKRKGGNKRLAGMRGDPVPMRQQLKKDGYLFVNLDLDGVNHSKTVHRLVLETFTGPAPEGCEACHFPDSSKENNRLDNLRWDSHRENIRDKYRHKIDAEFKKCRTCNEVCAISDFYTDKRAIDGRQGDCKKCHVKISMLARDPEKKRLANKLHMRRKRAAAKEQAA